MRAIVFSVGLRRSRRATRPKSLTASLPKRLGAMPVRAQKALISSMIDAAAGASAIGFGADFSGGRNACPEQGRRVAGSSSRAAISFSMPCITSPWLISRSRSAGMLSFCPRGTSAIAARSCCSTSVRWISRTVIALLLQA